MVGNIPSFILLSLWKYFRMTTVILVSKMLRENPEEYNKYIGKNTEVKYQIS